MHQSAGTSPVSFHPAGILRSFVPRRPPVAAVAFLIAAFATTARSQDSARFDAIGDLPGGTVFGSARGVSADGSIVVGFSNSGSGNTGFIWTEAGGLQPLATFPGATDHRVSDISADGSKIVGWAIVSTPGSGGMRALAWSGGGVSALPSFEVSPPVGEFMVAQGISADGSLIAGYGSNASNQYEGALWAGSGVIHLGFLPGGDSSPANDVSPDGSVIVGRDRLYYSPTQPYSVAWMSVGGGPPQSLGTNGNYESGATAVSTNGEVVVGYLTEQYLTGPVRAARWTPSGGWQVLEGTSGNSLPEDVTPDGTVIVGSMGGNAFIWTEAHGAKDIKDLLETEHGLDLTGWTLTRAVAVSDSGFVVVGEGVHDGGTKAWRAVVPMNGIVEPSEGDVWIAGTRDTIRWHLSKMDSVEIAYSVDFEGGSGTFTVIATDYPADSGMFVWDIPEDLLSRKCAISITDPDDPAGYEVSSSFRIKPYVLTRNTPEGDYDVYDTDTNAWGFGNIAMTMWPSSYWTGMDYRGIDLYTGQPFPSGWAAFASAPDSIFPDWYSFVKTFGAGACYINALTAAYSPTAVARWDAVKKPWRGSCFGMAIADAVVFRDSGAFRSKFPGFPEFTHPRTLFPFPGIVYAFTELQCRSFGNPYYATYAANVATTPNETISALKEMFGSEIAPIRPLTFFNNGAGGGGHAVIPKGLRRDTNQAGIYYLDVYDVSFPSVLDAQIVIDSGKNGGNGEWDNPLWPGWGGPLGLFLADPGLDYLAGATFQKTGGNSRPSPFTLPADRLEVFQTGAGSIGIEDSLGRVTGFIDSVVRREIPSSHPLVAPDGRAGQPDGYSVPLERLTVGTSGYGGDRSSSVHLFAGNRTFRVEREDPQPGERDSYAFDGVLSAINTDSVTKTMAFRVIINDTIRERTYGFGHVLLGQGDSVRLDLIDPLRLKLTSGRTAGGSYDVEVMLHADTGVGRFLVSDVPVGAGIVSHTLEPDWSDPAGTDLRILVDSGDDGSVDDTLMLSNTLTGVGGHGGPGAPAAFTLHQNYPNPFNPSTEIRFTLPERSRASLKVFDLLGREVATLAGGEMPAGDHTVRWNAAGAPAGVYVYRLVAGRHSGSGKMILLK